MQRRESREQKAPLAMFPDFGRCTPYESVDKKTIAKDGIVPGTCHLTSSTQGSFEMLCCCRSVESDFQISICRGFRHARIFGPRYK